MKSYRIVGSIWFYGGIIAFLWLLFSASKFWIDKGYTFTRGAASYLIYLFLATSLITIGWGFLNNRSWVKWPGYILAAIVGVFSVFFILMVGTEFGLYSMVFALLILLFSIYSIILIKKITT